MNKRRFQLPRKISVPSMTTPPLTKPVTIETLTHDKLKQTSDVAVNKKYDTQTRDNQLKTISDENSGSKLATVMAILKEGRETNVESAVTESVVAENIKETMNSDKITVEKVHKREKDKTIDTVKEKTKKDGSNETKLPPKIAQFKANCEALVEAQMRHRALQKESQQVNAQVQRLREEVVPFLVRHNTNRVNVSAHSMYIATRMTQRLTTIGVKQLYEIIEQTLGKESLAIVQREAETRHQQKRQVRETRIMPIKSTRKRTTKKPSNK